MLIIQSDHSDHLDHPEVQDLNPWPEVEFVHAVSAGGSVKFLPAV